MNVISIETAEDFDLKVLNGSNALKAVFFTAAWCPYCKIQKPRFLEEVKKYPNLEGYLLDVDKAAGIDDRYNVMTIPSVLFFKDGRVFAEKMIAYLQPHELAKWFSLVLKN